MESVAIIIPSHSNYTGVVQNFLSLLKKNWPDCPFDITVSLMGENKEIAGAKCIYSKNNKSLIDCILKAAKLVKKDYYICILGDAFINKKINNDRAEEIIQEIIEANAEYCSLKYVKNYKKIKKYGKYLRYINSKDRYSHSFIAFMTSSAYLKNELSRYKTDLDFEMNYLSESEEHYYDNHFILRKNYFNLLPSITKGKWDRINYIKLTKRNPDIIFDNRDKLSWKETIVFHLRNIAVYYLSPNARVIIKKRIEKKAKIKFGVEE